MTDSELVRRACSGDRPAVEALWAAHRRWVGAVLLAHRPRGIELDDLLQEVAVIVVQRLSELRDPTRLKPWLRRVAINVARTSVRREDARRRALRPARTDPQALADPRSDGAHPACAELLRRTLELARDLHPDYREPLLLRAVDGLSQAAVAEILELPVTTVETRLSRARAMLRRVLSEEGHVLPRRRRAAPATLPGNREP